MANANEMIQQRQQSVKTSAKAIANFEEKIRPHLTKEDREFIRLALVMDDEAGVVQVLMPPRAPRGENQGE